MMDLIFKNACLVLLVVEIIVLALMIADIFRKKKSNIFFIVSAVIINLFVYLIPYLHEIETFDKFQIHIIEIFDCVINAIKAFLADVDVSSIKNFANSEPIYYTLCYVLGTILASGTIIKTALENFSNILLNNLRLRKALRKDCCDLVIGCSDKALRYAKDKSAVLITGDSTDKDAATALIDAGYIVMKKGYCTELLKSKIFNKSKTYNIICPTEKGDNSNLDCIDMFIKYKKQTNDKKKYLFVETDPDKEETIRNEIIEKSNYSSFITVFCSDELLARSFMEKHPITQYLPKDFIDTDCSIKQGKNINIFFFGAKSLGRELYRQSVMNNQLVTYKDGQYRVLPIQYYIYETDLSKDEWNIGGLKSALINLEKNKENYFPLPELPYSTTLINEPLSQRDTISRISSQVKKSNTFSYIIVETGDNFKNIEAGTKLRNELYGCDNFHIFISSETAYTEDDEQITYFGDFESIFTHEVIINDELSCIAKRLHEDYTDKSSANYIPWHKLSHLKRYSNIYSGVNLRVKLNLLGLDYEISEECSGLDLIAKKHKVPENYSYDAYFERSPYTALLAQEHARWNAYHLLLEYLPPEIVSVTASQKEKNGKIQVSFNTQNHTTKKHACITTYNGLNDLFEYMAAEAKKVTGLEQNPEEFEYYKYDDPFTNTLLDLLEKLNFRIFER